MALDISNISQATERKIIAERTGDLLIRVHAVNKQDRNLDGRIGGNSESQSLRMKPLASIKCDGS